MGAGALDENTIRDVMARLQGRGQMRHGPPPQGPEFQLPPSLDDPIVRNTDPTAPQSPEPKPSPVVPPPSGPLVPVGDGSSPGFDPALPDPSVPKKKRPKIGEGPNIGEKKKPMMDDSMDLERGREERESRREKRREARRSSRGR